MAFSVVSYLGDYSPYFSAFGAISVVYLVFLLCVSLWDDFKTFCLAKILNLTMDFKRTGSWAVITGATDGIGKAFSRELARRGLNIVLVSRNPDKLLDVANLIEIESGVLTKCVAVDFTHGFSIFDKIKEEIGGLEIGVLFNNVGLAYDVPRRFLDIDGGEKMMNDLVHVNCHAVVALTRMVLPDMVKRRRGVIINNGSGSATRPFPLMTLYSATKAFTDFFSLGLEQEYKDKGVIVQSLLPFVVATKMSKNRPLPMVIPTPESYAKSALDTVGIQKRTFGCASHAVQAYLLSCINDWLFHFLSVIALNLFSRKVTKKREQKRQKAKEN